MQDSVEIFIRQADSSDAVLISVLGATTFYEAYFEQDVPVDLANYIADFFTPARILAELEDPNSTFFICYLKGKAVGYAKLRENSGVECLSGKHAVELQRIYILCTVWGRGIGEKLLEHCLEAAKIKGYQSLWLKVWDENVRALRFYEKQGFRAVGKTVFPYYSEGAMDFVMEREL